MRYRVRLLTIIPALALLFFAACAPVEPPQQDPTKEQITLLQKQLLELQKIQNDTKTKLDEATGTIEALTTRLKTLEEKQHIKPAAAPAPVVESVPAETKKVQPEKKKVTKKKPVKKKAKKKKPAKSQQPKTRQPQTQQPQVQLPQTQQPQQPQQPPRTQQ